MKRLAHAIALLLTLPAAAAQAMPLQGEATIQLATAEQTAAALGRRDRHINTLSKFDIQSRLKTDQDVSVDDLLAFSRQQALAWPPDEAARMAEIVAGVRAKLAKFRPMFPDTVYLALTTGEEEGGAAYCRGDFIVFPKSKLSSSNESLERLLLHELFHIFSRHNPKLREQLYEIVGFEVVDEIPLPESLADRKITNPDAPKINCVVPLEIDGTMRRFTPVLYSSTQSYDAERGGSFFRYLTFRLMEVEKLDGRWRAALDDGEPTLIDPRKLDAYYRRIGKNTRYIIHPEEVLAENFVLLASGAEDLKSPHIVENMRKLLVPNHSRGSQN